MDLITVERAYQGVEEAVDRYGMESAGIRSGRLMVVERTVPTVTAAMQKEKT
jgi:hypothetical protein